MATLGFVSVVFESVDFLVIHWHCSSQVHLPHANLVQFCIMLLSAIYARTQIKQLLKVKVKFCVLLKLRHYLRLVYIIIRIRTYADHYTDPAQGSNLVS